MATALIVNGPASAQQSPVSAYIQQAFGAIPNTNCNAKPGHFACSVPIVVVANTIHLPGDTNLESPATGSVRYCSASTTYVAAPIFAFVGYGKQRRSETSPSFADNGLMCELDFNLNAGTMGFVSPTSGGGRPSVVYNLQVLNGMLVGTSRGFTAVIVFGPPNITPVPMP